MGWKAGPVAVVGSANLDVVLTAPRRPDAGETLIGTGYLETAGGKGLNQALAVARISPCAFVGRVGDDPAADVVGAALAGAGVDVTYLRRGAGPTGRAFITVTPDGENSIVVVPLANADLDPAEVLRALDALAPRVVLTQLEVRPAVTSAVVAWCRERPGVRLVLNPSPVRPLEPDALRVADPLIVNAAEARALLAKDTTDIATVLGGLTGSLVMTRGAAGAIVVADGIAHEIPGIDVVCRDSTGAGDAFAGTLAAHLSAGRSLVDAATSANEEAARIVEQARSAR